MTGELQSAFGRLTPIWAFRRDARLFVTEVNGAIATCDDSAQIQTTTSKDLDLLRLQTDFARLRNAEQVRWAIQLSPDQQLVSDLTLPIMGTRRLGPAIAYQLELLYPFRIDQLYYGYRVLASDRSAREMTVRVVASPKAAVQPLIDRLRSAGVSIDGLCPADDRSLNMLPVEERASSGNSTKWLSAMAGMAAALVLVALTLPLWMQTHLADEAEARADAAVATVTPLLDIRNEVKKDLIDAQAALSASSQADIDDVLPRIMSGLGEKGSLQRVVYRAGEIQISGATQDAKKLAERIEQNALFEQPLFVTPPITDQATGLERFNLKFSLTPGSVQK